MKILFAANENDWGGFFGWIRKELPQHEFVASGRFGFDSLKGFDVLIPTMSVVGREDLQEADRLRLIQQCGAGLEGVDIPAARSMNIRVAHVPADISGNADSVAELGIYFMIGLSRHFRQMALSLANRKAGVPLGRALSGKTVGLIGLGGLGRALIKRLRSFDVRLIGIKRHDPQGAKEAFGLEWVGTPADLDVLLGRSDYVVLCLPLTADNRNIIGRNAFQAMKRDAYFINLARGGLVDRDALAEALASARIAGAGLDVYWEEPVDPNDPIFQYNVMATPHIAGGTDVSLEGMLQVVSENIRRMERGEEPLYQKGPTLECIPVRISITGKGEC